jgi:plasmid stabilization system protein ParE
VKIVWSAEARQELRAIRRFIARDSEFYAARMVARIVERVEKTASHPTRGHPVHEYPEALLKEVHEAPYRIIYRVSGDQLFVVTIVHFKKLLKT